MLLDLLNDYTTKNFKFNKEDYTFQTSLPGYSKDDLDISINYDTLTIKYTGDETEWKSKFKRNYTLNFDYDDAEASMENGILEVRFKVPKNKKAKQIKIN